MYEALWSANGKERDKTNATKPRANTLAHNQKKSKFTNTHPQITQINTHAFTDTRTHTHTHTHTSTPESPKMEWKFITIYTEPHKIDLHMHVRKHIHLHV